jgi:uncharacterized repeat protein (TIGR04076 family)
MEPKQYEVVIKLISNQQPCHCGHKIGDEWVFDYFIPAKKMCSLAYNAIYPMALALWAGGTFPWQEDPDVITMSCPDPEVHNHFELRRRVKKKP